MTPEEYHDVVEKFYSHGHRIFTVTFKRRTDSRNGKQKAGDLRHMVCRLHVQKAQGLDPNRKERDRENNLITVYEMAGTASGYKCVPVDAIVEISPAPLVEET